MRPYAPAANFAAAYGDTGTGSPASQSGSSNDPARTTRLQPTSAAASSTLTVLTRLALSVGSTASSAREPLT